jgi:hypothetical protein
MVDKKGFGCKMNVVKKSNWDWWKNSIEIIKQNLNN